MPDVVEGGKVRAAGAKFSLGSPARPWRNW